MGKHGVMTAKAIANKIKAKGLQRLRWYCQMCEKQCRDENGFKCHTMSESHQRQMLLFSQNSGKLMDQFSREFEQGYMDILSRRHTTKRVNSNVVYNEYIADKHHVHMNATMWQSLSEFVIYLGREGKCVVDETERGWYIQYIDRDPAAVARQAAREKKERHELDDEERARREIERQAEEARRIALEKGQLLEVKSTEMKANQTPISIAPLAADASSKANKKRKKIVVSPSQSTGLVQGVPPPAASGETSKPPKPVSNRERLAEEQRRARERKANQDLADHTSLGGKNGSRQHQVKDGTEKHHVKSETRHSQAKHAKSRHRAYFLKNSWVAEDLVVKVISKSLLQGKYHGKKAVVYRVSGSKLADDEVELEMLDTGKRVVARPKHLETVLPAIGKKVMIVDHDTYKGELAVLQDLHVKEYSATVKLSTDPSVELPRIPYEGICKIDG